MKPMNWYDYLRVGHVKRWHNVNTIRQQTVAEHSYMVMIIALMIFDRMVGIDPANRDSSQDTAYKIMAFAAFHDMPEVVSGDIPTPAKRFMREITKDPEIFDKIDAALMPVIPFFGCPIPGQNVLQIVKIADRIEGAYWIGENGAGKHAEVVAAANWRLLEDIVEKYDEEDANAGWYESVNHVLMNLGMRYVHKQSKTSPP